MKRIFENYEAFYNMLICSTIMSNAQTEELNSDSRKIIRFVGESYHLEKAFVGECCELILEQLPALGLTTDQRAVYSSRTLEDNYSASDVLFDIKGDVLSRLHNLMRDNPEIGASWFDYSHYKTYEPNVRFYKIYTASATGNLICNRQTGILQLLGIGCKKDMAAGIKRLVQCSYWGDIPSMLMLSYAYSLSGDKKNCALFSEVAELSRKYLLAGYTVLPPEASAVFSEEARTQYVYISSIKQDIVYAYRKFDIDFSFLEAFFDGGLDYYKKMEIINNYESKGWKNITNSSAKPTKALGF